MPKNKGGKKFRRGKHNNETKRPLILKNENEDQCYGHVIKVLGGGRFTVECYEKPVNIFIKKERCCLVRGSMRKRVWINVGDIVLVSLRIFQDEKADIMYKYDEYEVPELVNQEHIPNISDFSSTANENVEFNLLDSDDEAYIEV